MIPILQQYPTEKVLLVEKGKSITAGELLQTAQRLAHALQQQDIKKGDRVVIAVQPSVDFLHIIYANMLLRTVVAIIDPEMGQENYRAKLQQFDPQHAFVDSRLLLLNEHPLLKWIALKVKKTLPSFPKLYDCQFFTVGYRLPIFQKYYHIKKLLQPTTSLFPIKKEENEDEDFLITYTSGTLSQPKGVVHTYRSLANSLSLLGELLKKNKDQTIATHLPHFALLGLNAGVKVFLWDNEWLPIQKLNFIGQNNITTLFGPPSDFLPIIQYLKKAKKTFPDCLQHIFLGSAPIYDAFLKELLSLSDTLQVTCLYGMTENLMVAYHDGREKVASYSEGDLVGTPFAGVQIQIADDHEIMLYSPQLYSRYWQQRPMEGFHPTGDLGKWDNEGRLVLIGRKKEMIIRGNFNLYPALYEPTIYRIKGVVAAAIVGIYRSEKADEEVILAIESTIAYTEKELLQLLRVGQYSIDKEALPDRIVLMKIPRAGRQNKINRQAIIDYLKRI